MKKKNLLYIFADQWRAQAIGAAGEDHVSTPHMDRFAGESMAFDHAVSTYPLCSPHRASLLTGKYPYCCGMWTNCKIGLDETVMLKPQEVTILMSSMKMVTRLPMWANTISTRVR